MALDTKPGTHAERDEIVSGINTYRDRREPSPAPDQPGLTNYIDSDKHGASLGLSVALADLTEIFPKPVTFDLTGQYIYLEPRTYRKDDPADPIGDYVARGLFIGGSASARFVF